VCVGCGTSFHAVAFEASSEENTTEAMVLLQYMPIVRMQADWGKLTWSEIVAKFPYAETKAMIFILAIYQVCTASSSFASLHCAFSNSASPSSAL
jgi:hypothetical protein